MPLIAMLCVLALFPLQAGAFEQETLTVVEGQNLDLRCVMAAHNGSVLEWRNPREFVIFFQTWRGIRDQRYTITHYSNDALSIRLSNVTVHDEGVYTCFSYSSRIRRKQVKITVLAAPSKVMLEISRVRVDNQEENAVLRCSAWGSKPPPQIMWLLDSGVELLGDMDNQLEAKKFNSISIISVQTYTWRSPISCVIRHEALGEEKLTVTLYSKASALEKILNGTEEHSNISTPSPSAGAATLSSNSTLNDSEQQLNTTEAKSSGRMPSASTETPSLTSNTNNAPHKRLNVTKGPSGVRASSSSASTQILNFQTTDAESNSARNATVGNFSAQTTPLSTDVATLSSQITNEANLTYKEILKKNPSVLFPVLVTGLLFALLIIILLLAIKLWKAHQEWKKENDILEQTLESNRSKPNDDHLRQEKNQHIIPWKTSKKYVIHRSCSRTSKNSEESQDSSVFEKQVPYIKETDL
ncbi:cytotoxic and regulatory T-cell molecule isoform X1 [Pogona vitticeps]